MVPKYIYPLFYDVHVRFLSYTRYELGVSNKIITRKIKVIIHITYKLLFIVSNEIGHSI
jgi:hypothetical protein